MRAKPRREKRGQRGVDLKVESLAVANAFVEDFDVGDALRVGNDRGEEGDAADLGDYTDRIMVGSRASNVRARTTRSYQNSIQRMATSLGWGLLTMIAYEGKG